MKSQKKSALRIIAAAVMISFLSSCVVVVHDHPHRHWHHGPVVRERVIVR